MWMGRIGLSVVMVLGASVVSALAQPAVVEAYQGVRAAGLLGDSLYDVSADGAGGYVTASPDWGTPLAVRMGDDGRYMAIIDEGTGGGNFELVAVLWEVARGTEFLITGETSYDGENPGNTRIQMFSYDGGAWDDATDYTWPGVPLQAFLPDDMTIADLRALEAIPATVYVHLPPSDGYPVAHIWVNPDLARAVCEGEDWFVPADPAAYLRYCDRISVRVVPQRAVHWDAEYYRYRVDYTD